MRRSALFSVIATEPPEGIFVPSFSLKSYRGQVVKIRSLHGMAVLIS